MIGKSQGKNVDRLSRDGIQWVTIGKHFQGIWVSDLTPWVTDFAWVIPFSWGLRFQNHRHFEKRYFVQAFTIHTDRCLQRLLSFFLFYKRFTRGKKRSRHPPDLTPGCHHSNSPSKLLFLNFGNLTELPIVLFNLGLDQRDYAVLWNPLKLWAIEKGRF